MQASDQSFACQAADTNSTASQENSSSTLPLDVRSNLSTSGFSHDEKSSSFFSQEGSTLALDAQCNSSSVVHSQTGSRVLADSIAESSTNVDDSCVVKTTTETLDEMRPSDPIPSYSMPSGSYACQTILSVPTCVSGSVAIRPLMSIEVKPPAIPSLMSIKTSLPPFWCYDYSFGPGFPTPYRYPMPRRRGALQPHRNTSSTPGIVRQTTLIPALMSIETFHPVGFNGTRPFSTKHCCFPASPVKHLRKRLS